MKQGKTYLSIRPPDDAVAAANPLQNAGANTCKSPPPPPKSSFSCCAALKSSQATDLAHIWRRTERESEGGRDYRGWRLPLRLVARRAWRSPRTTTIPSSASAAAPRKPEEPESAPPPPPPAAAPAAAAAAAAAGQWKPWEPRT